MKQDKPYYNMLRHHPGKKKKGNKGDRSSNKSKRGLTFGKRDSYNQASIFQILQKGIR